MTLSASDEKWNLEAEAQSARIRSLPGMQEKIGILERCLQVAGAEEIVVLHGIQDSGTLVIKSSGGNENFYGPLVRRKGGGAMLGVPFPPEAVEWVGQIVSALAPGKWFLVYRGRHDSHVAKWRTA